MLRVMACIVRVAFTFLSFGGMGKAPQLYLVDVFVAKGVRTKACILLQCGIFIHRTVIPYSSSRASCGGSWAGLGWADMIGWNASKQLNDLSPVQRFDYVTWRGTTCEWKSVSFSLFEQ